MNIKDIQREITTLENSDANWENIERLSWLYTIVDHIPDLNKIGGSDFLDAVSRAPLPGVMCILDEHLQALNMLYPKEYKAILNKINQLKRA